LEQQKRAAESIVHFYITKMLNEARNTRRCDRDQLLIVLQRVVSRALVRDEKPKQIGRRAEEMAREYKRSLVKKHKADEFQQFDDVGRPCLKLISQPESP